MYRLAFNSSNLITQYKKARKPATRQVSIDHSGKLAFDQCVDSWSIRRAVVSLQKRTCESIGWTLLVFHIFSCFRHDQNNITSLSTIHHIVWQENEIILFLMRIFFLLVSFHTIDKNVVHAKDTHVSLIASDRSDEIGRQCVDICLTEWGIST